MSATPSPEAVRALIRAKWTQDAIARELGTTRHKVRAVINAMGIVRTLPTEPDYEEPRTYAEPSRPRRFSWEIEERA